MATTSVETSLSNLLPTLNDVLPPELVHLATSLLAQSRTRISLKQTEEIGRPYACAEIACNRLQSKLKLPSTHGRPPLPPKMYAKMLALMENGLQAQKPTRVKTTAGKQTASLDSSPAKGPSAPRRQGPDHEMEGSTSAVTTPVTTTGKKVVFAGKISARKPAGTEHEEEAPEWVMPLIRRLCAAFTTPTLPPHVYTGTCVVLKLAGLWPLSDSKQEHEFRNTVSAMTIAIYFMVLTKMQRGKITPEVYLDRCEKAMQVAEEMGSDGLSRHSVDDWIKRMNDEGWCRRQDWWDSVPENVMDAPAQTDGDAVDDLDEESDVMCSKHKRRRLIDSDQPEGDNEGVLLPGLGTMMQDAVDFLSEERMLDYLEWKEGVLKRIKQMEKGKGKAMSAR